jgi:hypothetical protein
LTDAQLDLNQALKNSLIDKFTQDQVTYLDLTAELKAEKEPLFWSQDYHLNHRGHRRVAEIVSAWLGPALHRMAASEAGR